MLYQHGLQIYVYSLFELKKALNPIELSLVAMRIPGKAEGHQKNVVAAFVTKTVFDT